MKINYENLDDIVARTTKKVVEQLLDSVQNEKPKLIARYDEHLKPIDEYEALLSQHEREIILGDDFQRLSTKEKLMVIKATIKTHYQVTEGYVISYGEIVNYELVYNKFLEQKKILFSINGELLEESMEQHL
jgi:hypothetical protein